MLNLSSEKSQIHSTFLLHLRHEDSPEPGTADGEQPSVLSCHRADGRNGERFDAGEEEAPVLTLRGV